MITARVANSADFQTVFRPGPIEMLKDVKS